MSKQIEKKRGLFGLMRTNLCRLEPLITSKLLVHIYVMTF